MLEYFCGKSWTNFQSLGGVARKFSSSIQTASTHPFGKGLLCLLSFSLPSHRLLELLTFSFLIFLTFSYMYMWLCVYHSLIFLWRKHYFLFVFLLLSFLLQLSLFCCFTIQCLRLRFFPPSSPFTWLRSVSHSSGFIPLLVEFLPFLFPSPLSPPSQLTFFQNATVIHSIYLSFSTAPIWGWWLTRCISYFGTLIPTFKNVTYNEISLKIVVKERSFKNCFFFSSQFLKSLKK